MSDDDALTADEEAALKADVQPPAKEEAPPEPAPAAVPEPPKAPEPVAAAPEPKPEEPRGGPNNVIAEMRRELAELRRREAAREAAAAPKPQEPQIPAFEADPAIHLKTRQDQTEDQVRAMLAERQQASQMQQIMGAYAVAAQDFSAQTADFQDAYKFLLSGRSAELQAIGLSGPELAHALKTDELAIVTRALRDGANPAERLYNVAKARGYALKAPEPPPAPPATPQPSMVEQVARGQQLAANPLANAGSNPVPELTPATLAAMSDDEVAALSPAQWRRAMGG